MSVEWISTKLSIMEDRLERSQRRIKSGHGVVKAPDRSVLCTTWQIFQRQAYVVRPFWYTQCTFKRTLRGEGSGRSLLHPEPTPPDIIPASSEDLPLHHEFKVPWPVCRVVVKFHDDESAVFDKDFDEKGSWRIGLN